MENDPKPTPEETPGVPSIGEGTPPVSSESEREALLGAILEDAGGAGTDPPPSSAPVSSSQQRKAMLAEVVQDSEAKEFARLPRTPTPGTTPLRLVMAVALTLGAAWLWLAPPAQLRPAPAPPTPAARVEAALRFAVGLQAERILAYRVETRRLPDFLREVGDTLPGMSYRRLDGGTFLLRARSGEMEVEYRSDESLEAFVSPALPALGAVP